LDWLSGQSLDEGTQRRLKAVVRRRADPDRFFDVAGKRWDRLRIEAFGEFFHLEALTALLPYDWRVADVGTGTGYMLGVLADRFGQVIAVDPNEAMLSIAKSRPEIAGRDNIEFRVGRAERLPIVQGELDLAIASLVLHHVPEPASGLSELQRCLRRGGRLLVIEQKPHRDTAFHDRMGDVWSGFAPEPLSEQVRAAGFEKVRYWPLLSPGRDTRGRGQAPVLFALVAESLGAQ
jgi:ArsR family transcriptional regulator